MNYTVTTVVGLLLPFLGTTLGAAAIFFLKNSRNDRLQNAFTGFASGVMIAASIWSLLLPAMEMEKNAGGTPLLPAVIGFLSGIGFLLLLDILIPHPDSRTEKKSGIQSDLGDSFMLVLAVTLHNIPEGMAVGVVFAGMMDESSVISQTGAFALSIGIAVQNLPEGAIISAPLVSDGNSKTKSFLYGLFSGIVEPVSAVLTILLTSFVTPILPYILAFAAGAMIYVVFEELIPESQYGKYSSVGTVGMSVGFALMMILDKTLG